MATKAMAGMRRLAGRTRLDPRHLCKHLPQDGPAQRRRRGEQGATMVETALSMLILLAILFGLIEMCLALYSYYFLSDAAREGTRYAIVHGSTCMVSGVSCTMTASQIDTYVKDLGYPGINPANMTVTTTYSISPGEESCVAAGCNGPGDRVTVLVNYNFSLMIPFVTSKALSMSSTSSMVISQ